MTSETQILWLSLKVATCATLILIPVGTLLGWLFARKRFAAKTFLEGLVNIPLVLPPVVTGYFLLILFGPNGYIGRYLQQWFGIHLAFTWKAAVLAAAVVSLPLLVRAVHVAVADVDPKLEEAARVLRTKETGIFFKVTLPLARHGIIAGSVLAFGRALGEFGATIVFASNIPGQTQTIPLAVFTFLNQPGGEAKARFLILIAIVLAYVSIFINEALLRRYRHVES